MGLYISRDILITNLAALIRFIWGNNTCFVWKRGVKPRQGDIPLLYNISIIQSKVIF